MERFWVLTWSFWKKSQILRGFLLFWSFYCSKLQIDRSPSLEGVERMDWTRGKNSLSCFIKNHQFFENLTWISPILIFLFFQTSNWSFSKSRRSWADGLDSRRDLDKQLFINFSVFSKIWCGFLLFWSFLCSNFKLIVLDPSLLPRRNWAYGLDSRRDLGKQSFINFSVFRKSDVDFLYFGLFHFKLQFNCFQPRNNWVD